MQAKYDSEVRYSRCVVFSIMWKVTLTPEGAQVLMSAVKVLECRESERYAVHNVQSFLLRSILVNLHYPNIFTSAQHIAAIRENFLT